MDSLITAAARALAAGDPLGALNRVALREDAPALALRGIAMAQLGDFARAKELLRSATRAFGQKEALARARCIVAEAEIALASRDLGWPAKMLDVARATLEAHGDVLNAGFARYLEVRRLLLIGQLDEAERLLGDLDPSLFPPASRTFHELVIAGIGMRRLRTKEARAALARAESAARQAGIPSLMAEVESASHMLNTPVLFALARALAEAWPGDVPRDLLLARAFGARFVDESHRARLRVEIGRLRRMLRRLVEISATKRGFALVPQRGRKVVVLARPVEEEHADVLAFLADGESWSSSALALALGASQRTVQRALDSLAAAGKVQSFGQARARRWITPPVPGFTTILLLPAPLPTD